MVVVVFDSLDDNGVIVAKGRGGAKEQAADDEVNNLRTTGGDRDAIITKNEK